MEEQDRFLKKVGKYWYYFRRAPARYGDFDDQTFTKKSLKTRSIVIARERRDAIVRANEDYWAAWVGTKLGNFDNGVLGGLRETILRRYEAACLHAVSLNLREAPVNDVLVELRTDR